ncbi:MAG: hypothetical protein AAFP76_17400 [Bacteroidota bacterium]
MRKLILTLTAISFLAVSCGESVEVSPEMQGFMEAIDATNSMDDAAEKYGFTSDDIALGFYELKNPEVTAATTEGATTCYDVNIKHGIIDSNVKVCWEDGKITSISELE